jgi:hypothetical protein
MNSRPALSLVGFSQRFAQSPLRRQSPLRFLTRGKRLVALIGQKEAVAVAVRNASGRRKVVEAGRMAVCWSIHLMANWFGGELGQGSL